MSSDPNPRDLARLLATLDLKLAVNEAWKLLQTSGSTPAPTLSAREVIQLSRTVLQGAAFLAWEAPTVAGTADPVASSKWLDYLEPEAMLAIQRAREKARQAG